MLTPAEEHARDQMLAYIERLEAKLKVFDGMREACKDLVFWAGQQPAGTYSHDQAFRQAYHKASDFFRDEWEKQAQPSL